MKPFSIVCKSCAARLKVSKASAVNQLLGCPKCATMIRVTPPKGWVPPEPIKNSASFESSSQVDIPVPSSSDPFGGDFDDIDQILAKPQQPGATSPRHARQPSADPQKTKNTERRAKLKQKKQTAAASAQSKTAGTAGAKTAGAKTAGTKTAETKTAETKTAETKTAGSRTAQTRPTPVPPSPPPETDADPMLPNDQWQSDETRKRKRLVSVFVFLLGGLMLLGAIGAAVFFNLPKEGPAVAKNDDPAQGEQADDDRKKIVNINHGDEPRAAVLNPNDVEQFDNAEEQNQVGEFVPAGQQPEFRQNENAHLIGNPGAIEAVEVPLGGEQGARIPDENFRPGNMQPIDNQPQGIDGGVQNNNQPPVGVEIPGGANDPTAQAPNAIGNRNPRPAIPPIGIPGQADPDNDPKFPKPKLPGGPSPLEVPPLPEIGPERGMAPKPGGNAPAGINIEPAPPKKKVASLDKMDGKIGDLAGLLERNGTSLNELRDIADGFEVNLPAGIPKYNIKKPDEIKPNLDKRKHNVDGMLFDKAPLPQVTRVFATITGIPITIDAEAITDAGKNPNEPISITIKESDVETALNKILVPLGLTKKEDGHGFTITVANSEVFTNEKIALPNSSKLDDAAKQRFLAYIQGMIDPEVWVREQNPASVKIEGNQIIANCSPNHHAKLNRLVEKLKASLTLIDDDSDATALVKLETRSNGIIDKLQQKIEVRHSIQLPINKYLTKLQKKTGISVIADWPDLISVGWNPKTKVPGNIDEPTAQEVIQRLAESMNLTVKAINAETLLLTTISKAESSPDVEVYSVAKLLKGKFDNDSIVEIFETTLGNSLRTSRYVYDPTCQCFIVAAPQSKQRQVEALFERLEKL